MQWFLAALMAVSYLWIKIDRTFEKHHVRGSDIRNILPTRRGRQTVEDAVARIETRRPEIRTMAEKADGSLRILVFKLEGRVEVSAPGWKAAQTYKMGSLNRRLGPKLRKNDGQIPEGFYRVESLLPINPNHLSLRLDYPNAFDRTRAQEDGRSNLGGDIMIHGTARSDGCIAIGDSAIEELFCCAAAVGPQNVSVLIAPYDMRRGRRPNRETADAPPWYSALCTDLFHALQQ